MKVFPNVLINDDDFLYTQEDEMSTKKKESWEGNERIEK